MKKLENYQFGNLKGERRVYIYIANPNSLKVQLQKKKESSEN